MSASRGSTEANDVAARKNFLRENKPVYDNLIVVVTISSCELSAMTLQPLGKATKRNGGVIRLD